MKKICTICNKLIQTGPVLFSGKDTYCMSCQIDKVADKMGIDRDDIRRKQILLCVIGEASLVPKEVRLEILEACKQVIKGTTVEHI